MPSLLSSQEHFVSHCRYTKSLSINTARAYAQDLSDFTAFVGASTSLASVTSGDIELYVQDILRRRSLSPATAKRRLGCLRVYFSWLRTSGTIQDNPIERLKLPIRLPHRLPRTITRDELRSLIRATTPSRSPSGSPKSTALSSAVHLAILLMASTGIRVAELTAIAISDVDALEGRIRIHGKGSRERTAHVINAALRQKLKSHIRHRLRYTSEAGYLFVNDQERRLTTSAFRSQLKQAAISAGIGRRVTPHMLRHTAATLLLEDGVDMRFVQRLLGHQSISTTEIYTHITDINLRIALARADLVACLNARR